MRRLARMIGFWFFRWGAERQWVMKLNTESGETVATVDLLDCMYWRASGSRDVVTMARPTK